MNPARSVAFVCVHNSCRSQIAEAFAKILAPKEIHASSAGTAIASQINQDAVRLMKIHEGIDMEATQSPKTLEALPEPVDILVTMGCNVSCPSLPAKHREDWGLADPSGLDDAHFLACIAQIKAKVRDLQARIQAGQL